MPNHKFNPFFRMMCCCILLTVSVTVISSIQNKQKPTISVQTLLNEMISTESPSLFPDPTYTSKQISSYDRRSISPKQSGWFANNDGFGVESVDTIGGIVRQVLFDEEGPGAITRIWITTSNKEGQFKFYFDGATEPNWVIEKYDLSNTGLPLLGGLAFRHTHYEEKIDARGGNTFFLPIPYAKRCKIVFESPVIMGATPRYYHINYRTYPKGTNVKTFNIDEVKKLTTQLKSICNTLKQPLVPVGKNTKISSTLSAGKTLSLNCPNGKNAIQQLNFHIDIKDSIQYAAITRKLIVKAQFDGKETIWVPLSDFSGGGMGSPAVKSYYLDTDGKGNMTIRWIMPYQKTATIELLNISDHEVKATLTAWIKPYQWDKKRSLYFHANWKQENHLELSNSYDNDKECKEWRFAQIEGRGVYAGDLLSLFNYTPAWYGEGDEKIWVDNDTFPSHFGTGTEDYYNCSWAPVIPFQTPFGGAPRADLPSSHGYNAFMRTRNLDVIPFNQKFIFDIEMLSWQKGYVDYSTTIFWYGDLDAKAIGCSGLEEAKRELVPTPPNPVDYKIENCVEFENLKIIDKSPSIRTENQYTGNFEGKWSKAAQLLVLGGNPGDYITFRFDNLENRPYRISVYTTKAADYGIISFLVNGKEVTRSDCYSLNVSHADPIDLGTFTPEKGSISLQVKISGTNPKSVGAKYMFGLDCISIQ